VPFFFSTTPVGYSLLIVGGNWPDFITSVGTSVLSLFFVSLGIIGYLRNAIPMVERALLFLLAFGMVVVPIGWSILGMAPSVVGGLIVVRHLRGTRVPVPEKEAQV